MEGPRFEGLPGSKKGLAKSNSLKLGFENPGRPKNGFLPHPPNMMNFIISGILQNGRYLFVL